MIISLVAAVSDNNVIGYKNRVPWRMPADVKFFKNLTMNHTVIMGRKTYQSLDKPLSGRINIVISRNKDFLPAGCLVASSFEDALNLCNENEEVFIIGGEKIYRSSIAFADKIYLTRIHADFEGDTYFPEINHAHWIVEKSVRYEPDEKNPYPWSFILYCKKN
jgi:dihydrofolate reductase